MIERVAKPGIMRKDRTRWLLVDSEPRYANNHWPIEAATAAAARALAKSERQRLREIAAKSKRHWDEIGQPYPEHLQALLNQLDSDV